jgi:hypothetical protein
MPFQAVWFEEKSGGAAFCADPGAAITSAKAAPRRRWWRVVERMVSPPQLCTETETLLD